ncbi:hypothetical protein CBM2585_A140136 [Cupriavidus taiwanensis]|nr:hypothetical protein CBM2585_A140136 [Cupriavidus taiwanensis]
MPDAADGAVCTQTGHAPRAAMPHLPVLPIACRARRNLKSTEEQHAKALGPQLAVREAAQRKFPRIPSARAAGAAGGPARADGVAGRGHDPGRGRRARTAQC